MKVVTAKKIFAANDQIARENRLKLDRGGAFTINVLGSPGTGKTSLLEALLPNFNDRKRVAVIEGDLATSLDAERVEALGFAAVQVNTGGGCHLDAAMIASALESLEPGDIEFLFIENVGNLICPANFDLGEHLRMAVLSVTEGDDKIVKYPPLFRSVDLLVINKIDLLPHTDFDLAAVAAGARRLSPEVQIFELSAKTGEGVAPLAQWLQDRRGQLF